jgi:hypothetical protein
MFFSRVRRRGGWNNNPNAVQFKYAIRAILAKNSILPSKKANCIEEPVVTLFSKVPTEAELKLDDNVRRFSEILESPSEFHDHALHYIAGYIIRHILPDCKCTACCLALQRNDGSRLPSGLTDRKNRGGLVMPCDDVFKIVKTADTVLR